MKSIRNKGFYIHCKRSVGIVCTIDHRYLYDLKEKKLNHIQSTTLERDYQYLSNDAENIHS
ncbi:MAG: hypothetical protein RMJ51_02625 [Candidatus Calescibacterium sp.]|nr:hypothetical protein [Candidatus Calescibacterium sp.]MCX7972275.1 hypothetical protein [bacterium]MDW8195122.1 hypothetical protein [Candidatus Calescibacterium sp.]